MALLSLSPVLGVPIIRFLAITKSGVALVHFWASGDRPRVCKVMHLHLLIFRLFPSILLKILFKCAYFGPWNYDQYDVLFINIILYVVALYCFFRSLNYVERKDWVILEGVSFTLP